MASGGKPFPQDTMQKKLLTDEGQEQAIVGLCFDNNTATSCFNKTSNVNISSLSATFPCPGSGLQGLDRVDVYNTQ